MFMVSVFKIGFCRFSPWAMVCRIPWKAGQALRRFYFWTWFFISI